jgi:CPA2 family monovalent cation:H+ antiporter-2
VVLVGYGRVGKRIAAELRAHRVPFVVAEQNRELVDALRDEGVPAVSGDAATPDVLVQAHAARAAMLVVAIPDTVDVRRMVEIARTLNPGISVVLRTHSEEEAALLTAESQGTVFLGEHELARGMSAYILAELHQR